MPYDTGTSTRRVGLALLTILAGAPQQGSDGPVTERNVAIQASSLREVQAIAPDHGITIPPYLVVDLHGVRDRVTVFTASKDTILRLGGIGLPQ
jgi:hypothetical protein